MKKFLRALSIISILAIFCCITGCNYNGPETTTVKATVTSKEHIDSYTNFGYYFDGWKGNLIPKVKSKVNLFPELTKFTKATQLRLRCFSECLQSIKKLVQYFVLYQFFYIVHNLPYKLCFLLFFV